MVPGTGPRATEEGLGDIIAGVTYRDLLGTESSRNLAVDLTGKIKFGTAVEDKGLGAGENDYTIQTNVYKFIDRWTPFAMRGYRYRGDPPDANLNDGWIADAGARYRLSDQMGLSGDYYYRGSSVSGADDLQELSVTLDYRLSPDHKILGYLIKGLSDGSPDWGVGIMLTVRD